MPNPHTPIDFSFRCTGLGEGDGHPSRLRYNSDDDGNYGGAGMHCEHPFHNGGGSGAFGEGGICHQYFDNEVTWDVEGGGSGNGTNNAIADSGLGCGKLPSVQSPTDVEGGEGFDFLYVLRDAPIGRLHFRRIV